MDQVHNFVQPSPREWILDKLSIGFTKKPIVQDIQLHVQEGDLLIISGENGSGKSCLLKTMSGELAPLAGAIHAPADFSAEGLGVVPQLPDLQPRLPITLGEMAAIGTAGLRVSDQKERLAFALDLLELSDRSKQAWQASSGGERQRALIARALIRRPEVLLMDEATSHLDAAGAEKLFFYLQQECLQKRLTVVAVVHDMELLERFATKRLHVAKGKAILRTHEEETS